MKGKVRGQGEGYPTVLNTWIRNGTQRVQYMKKVTSVVNSVGRIKVAVPGESPEYD